jgi:GTPase Era involved in 16S rRNA processing
MKQHEYKARKIKNAGRNFYSVAFRHPRKQERGKPGRQVCKGLGTDDEAEADKLVADLNKLLATPDLHALASVQEARRQGIDPRIIEIFYEGMEATNMNHRDLRDQMLPFPAGHTQNLLMGITGSGKSTLLRRLIGSTTDRFPATSINRTTTCQLEIVTGAQDYTAAVTFLSQHQAQQEVVESLSAAVLKSVKGEKDGRVMNELLEQSDMRFRLKYILGDWEDEESDDEFVVMSEAEEEDTDGTTADQKAQRAFLEKLLKQIRRIGEAARATVEPILGKLDELIGDDLDYALDEIQEAAEQSDDFLDMVSEVMAEIRHRFDEITEGKYTKSSTGWPSAWKGTAAADGKKDFLKVIRKFIGNSKPQWGTLLTPLVNGVRVQGPFRPEWAAAKYDHVFIDTEGLLHGRANADVPAELTELFKMVDSIVLVESAKNALSSPAAAKAFEAVASTGYTKSFALVFTHMDHASGEDLRDGKAKKEKVFGGVRNVLDNQIAKTLSRDAARHLETQLQTNTFYFAHLDGKFPTKDEVQITKFEKRLGRQLLEFAVCLAARKQPDLRLPGYPKYSMRSLGLAVREASLAFIESWEAKLGFKYVDGETTVPWQSLKALSHRYAEGWLRDGFWLRPIDQLTANLRNVLTKFLDNPIEWGGQPVTDEEKLVILDGLKQRITEPLAGIAEERLRKLPMVEWQAAYGLRGKGTTVTRRHNVRSIFQAQIPVPESRSDRASELWMEEIEKVVTSVVEQLQKEAELVGGKQLE